MQPISEYEKFDKFRVILQGPPGSGKTGLAAQFLKPYIIDLDVNLGGVIYWLQKVGKQLPLGFNRVDIDEKGLVVPMKQRYERLNKFLMEAQANPEIETIVLDSATNLADILSAEVCRQQGKNQVSDFKDGRQFWGFFFQAGKSLMSTLTSMRKHIVLTAHEKTETDPDGNVVYPIKVAWPGQLGDLIGAFFTDVWRCEIKATPAGLNAMNYQWLIRTMPDNKFNLKNSRMLPPVFEYSWEKLAQTLTPPVKP